MYKLLIAQHAKKQIKNISKLHQKAVLIALSDIKENPSIGKRLMREHTGKYSYRVGAYRIIYIINQSDLTVCVLSAGHRSIIYS